MKTEVGETRKHASPIWGVLRLVVTPIEQTRTIVELRLISLTAGSVLVRQPARIAGRKGWQTVSRIGPRGSPTKSLGSWGFRKVLVLADGDTDD